MAVDPTEEIALIDKLLSAGRIGAVKQHEKKAVLWFADKVADLSGHRPWHPTRFRAKQKITKISADEYLYGKKPITGDPVIGQMFVYRYDPKHKDTLPYYDTFPLVLPIAAYPDGWLGLNLHYLAPVYRARLLKLIMETMTSKKLTREAKARFTYGMIKSAGQYSIAGPCIKRYLSGHVVSKIVRVNPAEWADVAILPMDSFQKQPREVVWRESVAAAAKANSK